MDKLSKIKIALTSNLKTRFYGFYLSYFSFIESKDVETLKITAKDREIKVLYNGFFIQETEDSVIGYYLIHIAMHLMANHPKRGKKLADKNLSHISQDCILKYLLDKNEADKDRSNHPFILGLLKTPQFDGVFSNAYQKFFFEFLEDDMNEIIFEDLYFWFMDNLSEEEKEGLEGSSIDDDSDEDMGEMDFLVLDKVSEKIFSDYAKNHVFFSSDISKTLQDLKREPEDPLSKIIHNALFQNISGSENITTFKKPNRRGYEGYKGKIKRAKTINLVLDTSGSMSDSMEIVLSQTAQDGYLFNLFQIDAEIKEERIMTDLSGDDLSNLVVFGGGGTVLMPAINYISKDERFYDNPTVILTDGYTDVLDFTSLKYPPLIITCGITPKTIGKYDLLTIKQKK